MINESQKHDPRMWKKWKESGAIGTSPEEELKRFRATLTLEPPDSLQNNWKISFTSEERDDQWRRSYASAIINLAKEKDWRPFFQSGQILSSDNEMNMPVATYHMIEMWKGKDPKEIEETFEEIHRRAFEDYQRSK